MLGEVRFMDQQVYTTKQGEMLDEICFRFYGRTAGTVEAVLEANPGLSALPPVFEEGTTIVLPDLGLTGDRPTTKETVRLWS